MSGELPLKFGVAANGASNFYYYGMPLEEAPEGIFPAGQWITTQLPADIAKIRIVAILALTAIGAAITAASGWCWTVIIIGVTYAAVVAYQHLLTEDPLVKVFYNLAGGKAGYDLLPEIKLDPKKETRDNFGMLWQELEHPLHRFTTSDGRKGLLVKGLSHLAERSSIEAGIGGLSGRPFDLVRTEYKMIFIEKLGPRDLPSSVASEQVRSFFEALRFLTWGNSFSTIPLPLSSTSSTEASYRMQSAMHASISTDMANEFFSQMGKRHELAPAPEPRIEELSDEESESPSDLGEPRIEEVGEDGELIPLETQ